MIFLPLGTNSALPSIHRFSSCFIVKGKSEYIMLDCGEGAQIKLSQYKVKRNNIKYILISHLHGDHVFGLPGMITSFSLNNRSEDLKVIGPIGTLKLINTILECCHVRLRFQLEVIEISPNSISKVLESSEFIIQTFPLEHRVATQGYKITQKSSVLKFNEKAIAKYNLKPQDFMQLRSSNAFNYCLSKSWDLNEIIYYKQSVQTLAYCTDTVFNPQLYQYLFSVDVLYHESTYLDEFSEEAKARFHSTASQAALVAKCARVKKLFLGHFSSRYGNLDAFSQEAKLIFPNVSVANEGVEYVV